MAREMLSFHSMEKPAGTETSDYSSITQIFEKSKLERIQECIAKATGLAFVTVDYTGEPVTEMTCFTEYCARVRSNEKSCAICKKSDAFGALQAAMGAKPSVYFCPCGFLETAIPIESRGAFLGGFLGGQVICDDAPEDTPKLSHFFKHNSEFINSEEMNALRGRIKRYSFAQFTDAVNLIHLIVNLMLENESANIKKLQNLSVDVAEQSEKVQNLNHKISVLEQKISNLEMNLNQYFLSNTLSSISSLAVLENASQCNSLLLELAEFMRGSGHSPDKFWNISDEITHIEHYVRISTARFGVDFSYKIQLPEKLKNRKIPVYSILPFVENAVYYGIALAENRPALGIRISLDGNMTVVSIEENGPGYSNQQLQEIYAKYEGNHEGAYIDKAILHAEKRMKITFGEDFSWELKTEHGAGRTITIRIPPLGAGDIRNENSIDCR